MFISKIALTKNPPHLKIQWAYNLLDKSKKVCFYRVIFNKKLNSFNLVTICFSSLK